MNQLFYAPNIKTSDTLPTDEANHAHVLRLKKGQQITITDGAGNLYQAIITNIQQKICKVNILKQWKPTQQNWNIHLAIAPTKNNQRIDWCIEKLTEIGIDQITFLHSQFSEKHTVNTQRLQKIFVQTIKQSQQATLPRLTEITPFDQLVKTKFDGQKFVAHCNDDFQRITLKQACQPNTNTLILIGPEGDFGKNEVQLAENQGFISVSLGNNRLRTETAAIVACHTVHVVNQ